MSGRGRSTGSVSIGKGDAPISRSQTSHTSLTVVLVAVAFRYGMRLRWSVAALGGTVILATFVLGIHWLPDLAAGIATGILGTALAIRLDHRLAHQVP